MEIDFLGLHSSKSQCSTSSDGMSVDHPPITPTALFSAMGSGVETSLSLGTTTSSDSHTNFLNFSQQQKQKKSKRNFGYYNKEGDSPGRAVFLYDLNDSPGRDVSEIPSSEAPSFNMACRGACPNALPDKGDIVAHGISRESGACMIGDRPTIAMARRATLARFLEKRLHRLNQARTSHLIKGKSNNCEDS